MTENTSEILLQAMHKLGLSRGQRIEAMAPLTGGVSSDIWRIDFETHSICAKRALAQLKVSALWQAPLSRNAFEYDWYQVVAPHFPQHVPQMLGRDEEHGIFFMSYLEPSQHPVWKERLLQGQIDPDFAASVGDALGGIHQLSANSADLAQRFKSDPEFYSLRLEPYLLATAQKHPELAAVLETLCQTCAQTRLALVHGDVSPKNILCAPGRPIFLDAECAWYGDPAFDLAFCLNHLLLKMIHRPDRQQALALSFSRLTQAYLRQVQWESLASLEQRTARLLPALLLARVDGKSPVEYLREAHQHQTVRHIAQAGLLKPVDELERVLELTMKALNA